MALYTAFGGNVREIKGAWLVKNHNKKNPGEHPHLKIVATYDDEEQPVTLNDVCIYTDLRADGGSLEIAKTAQEALRDSS